MKFWSSLFHTVILRIRQKRILLRSSEMTSKGQRWNKNDTHITLYVIVEESLKKGHTQSYPIMIKVCFCCFLQSHLLLFILQCLSALNNKKRIRMCGTKRCIQSCFYDVAIAKKKNFSALSLILNGGMNVKIKEEWKRRSECDWD